MYLSENRLLRLVVLCAMYIAQGLPYGFITVAVMAYLSKNGVTKEDIGYLMAAWTLPWSFKWIWGPAIDRFTIRSMGRRRPWILFAQSMMAITIGAMIAITDMTESMRVVFLLVMVIVHNIFGSLQDVSVDALAVDLLSEDERGRANGLMYGSSYFGAFLGATGLGWVLVNYGLRKALICQVSLLLAIMLLPLFFRERRGDLLWPGRTNRDLEDTAEEKDPAEEKKNVPNPVLRNLLQSFLIPSSILAAVIALGSRLGSAVLTAIGVEFYIEELGWTLKQYTSTRGTIDLVCGLGGSILGGVLADVVGHKRLASIAAVLIGLIWIAFASAQPYWADKSVVTAMWGLQTFFEAVFSVSLFAMFMTVSWPRVAATQFTAYMALMNLSTTIGSAMAGVASKSLSVSGVFASAGLIQCSLIVVIFLVQPDQTRQRLGDE